MKGHERPIVGYFLRLRKLCGDHNCVNWTRPSCRVYSISNPCDNPKCFYRWIEYNAIAFKRVDIFTVEMMCPMGKHYELYPCIEYSSRKEMMSEKRRLNTEIVRRNEPHNWRAWGIE